MLKVSDQQTVQESLLTLEPYTLASSIGGGDDGSVVDSHVDLIANDSGEVESPGVIQRLVVNKAMGRVRTLSIVRQPKSWERAYLHLQRRSSSTSWYGRNYGPECSSV